MPRLKGENKKRYDELRAQLQKFDHLYHSEEPMGSGMRDLGPQGAAHACARGRQSTRAARRGGTRVSDDPRSGAGEDRAAARACSRPAAGRRWQNG